ncbi:MAG TPA: VanZ family protein [Syntrophomonadaceae bacterium]|nr:VanZ family protein [Syntrophomonadaceae bacterium]
MKVIKGLIICVLLAVILVLPRLELEKEYIYPVIKDNEQIEKVLLSLPRIQYHYANRLHDSHADPVKFAQFTIRKVAHAVLYGLLGLVFVWILIGRRFKGLLPWILAGGAVLLIAILDEVNQYYLVNRTGCIEDVLVDMSGYVIFAILILVIRRL